MINLQFTRWCRFMIWSLFWPLFNNKLDRAWQRVWLRKRNSRCHRNQIQVIFYEILLIDYVLHIRFVNYLSHSLPVCDMRVNESHNETINEQLMRHRTRWYQWFECVWYFITENVSNFLLLHNILEPDSVKPQFPSRNPRNFDALRQPFFTDYAFFLSFLQEQRNELSVSFTSESILNS